MAYPDYPSNVVAGLQPGIPKIVPQTTAFALLGRLQHLRSSAALDLSIDGTTYTTVTATTTGIETAVPYARCTISTATVIANVVA